jgi:hypothetical protein
MFCPSCRYEYNPTVTICPDCDERLVSVLPEKTKERDCIESDNKDWVQLARLTAHDYAKMLVEAFRDNDIPAVVLGGSGHFGQTGQMGPSSARPIGGGFSLMVPRECVVEADQIAGSILGEAWEQAKLFDVDS